MEDLIFRLSRYNNYEVSIPRDRFLRLFPTGLIATTLELDPEATDIDIPTAIITPDILDFFQSIVMEGKIPDIISVDKDNLYRTGDYLQLDLLQVVADPLYSDFHQTYPEINLVDRDSLNTDIIYNSILEYALRNHYSSLLDYLFENTNPEEHQEADRGGVSISAVSNDIYGLQQLIKVRRANWMGDLLSVDETTDIIKVAGERKEELNQRFYARGDIPSIEYAMISGNWEILQFLLPYVKDIARYISNWIAMIGLASQYGIAENLIDLYGIPNQTLSPSILNYFWMGPPRLIDKIYNYPTVTPLIIRSHLLPLVSSVWEYDAPSLIRYFNIIVDNPKVPSWFPSLVKMMNEVARDDLKSLERHPIEDYLLPLALIGNQFVIKDLIQVAIQYNSIQTFRYLIGTLIRYYKSRNRDQPGATINQFLEQAVRYNRPEMVDLILWKWNRSAIGDIGRQNAYNYAKDRGFTDVMNVIQKYT